MIQSFTVVVGNPKPRSRTYEAAGMVANVLAGNRRVTVVDLADLGADILRPTSAAMTALTSRVIDSRVTMFATPTYKGTYTGLLKTFLDAFPQNALADRVAIPLMMAGGSAHSLAIDAFLKPVLAHLGCACPPLGMFMLESNYRDLSAYEVELSSIRRFLNLNAA